MLSKDCFSGKLGKCFLIFTGIKQAKRQCIVKELKKYYGVGSLCRTLLYCLQLAALYYFFTSPTIFGEMDKYSFFRLK